MSIKLASGKCIMIMVWENDFYDKSNWLPTLSPLRQLEQYSVGKGFSILKLINARPVRNLKLKRILRQLLKLFSEQVQRRVSDKCPAYYQGCFYGTGIPLMDLA